MVRVEVAPPTLGVTEAGLKLQAAPVGSPEQARATALLKPLTEVSVMVEVPELPALTVAGERADAAIWKFMTLKVAVTAVAAFTTTLHAPAPEQAPLHPAKLEPAAGVAVSATAVATLKLAEHVPGQEIPAGALVTAPVPAPAVVTVRAAVSWVYLATKASVGPPP